MKSTGNTYVCIDICQAYKDFCDNQRVILRVTVAKVVPFVYHL